MSFDLALLAKAAFIGLSIAAPVGPIALLIMQRTLAEGLRTGLACGLGTAGADALYGLLAAFGLVAASALLDSISWWVGLAGALFLLYLGLKILLGRPAARAAEAGPRQGSLAGAFATTLLLTLSNPLTIVSFLAVFASLGVAASGAPGAAATVVAGVFLGSLAWQWGLVALAGLTRRWMAAGLLVWVNRASGLLLLGFAGWLLWRALST